LIIVEATSGSSMSFETRMGRAQHHRRIEASHILYERRIGDRRWLHRGPAVVAITSTKPWSPLLAEADICRQRICVHLEGAN
jgi:hypothetical protein